MTQQALSTYAPSEVIVVISHAALGINTRLSGLSEDSFVTVSRDAETWTHVGGADNQQTRVHNANKSGKVTVNLNHTSNSNDVLDRLRQYDERYLDSRGLFTIVVTDGTGRSTYASTQAYVSKVPESGFGSGVGGREWVINCTDLTHDIGGNSVLDVEVVEILNKLGFDVADRWKK